MHKFILASLACFLMFAFLPACSSLAVHNEPKMAPMSGMLAEVQSAPVSVQQAYQFAAANPELMKQIPCYCGCGNMGHTSNYSCYISGVDGKGVIAFDRHALGCSICVDITQDAMRLSQDGQNGSQIKAYVDATYSKYGTSNMP